MTKREDGYRSLNNRSRDWCFPASYSGSFSDMYRSGESSNRKQPTGNGVQLLLGHTYKTANEKPVSVSL